MGRTRTRQTGLRLSPKGEGSAETARRPATFRPRLELLEDRIQLGDTILGLSAVALWGLRFTSLDGPVMLDPGAHDHRWADGLYSSLDTEASQLLEDPGRSQAVTPTVGDSCRIGPIAEMTDAIALSNLASTDALLEHSATYRLPWLPLQASAATLGPAGGEVGAPWLGSGVQFSPGSFAGVG